MIDLLEMGLVSYRGDLQYDHSDDYGHKYSAIRNRVNWHGIITFLYPSFSMIME
jgi:hypothetical protein